jgi:hypothetical protein
MVDFTKFAADPDRADHIKWNVRPLIESECADPYPVWALPRIIGDAVREVEAWVQAPTPLIAASAISAVSASIQTRFSVHRNHSMAGPATLYLLTVAESGERKTFIDKLFTVPIVEWQAEQRQEHKRQLAEYKLDLAEWERARPESEDRDDLLGHDMAKPEEPRERRVLRSDDTTEALIEALQRYPIAVINSAEAGLIFGSHSMKAENVTANLALANTMWDGDSIHQERIKRGVIHVERPRVTMSLQVQPEVLEKFILTTGGLAKGIGYFARFLFSYPESTIGRRFFEEAPADQPALRRFQSRTSELLKIEPEFDVLGRLDPHYVEFDADAYQTWIKFHDEVEEQLGDEQTYAGVRGEGSKAPENAARLACCLHVFQNGSAEPINAKTMTNACTLMRWYLNEAVRLGRTRDATPEVHHAQLLEEWLVGQVKRRRGKENADVFISVNEARKLGPNALRGGGRVDAAVELLHDLGRLRLFRRTGRKGHDIIIAPAVQEEYGMEPAPRNRSGS